MNFKTLCALLLCLPAIAQAIERNDVPDCYGYAKIDSFRQKGSGRELTVIIDQTIPMPEGIQKAAWAQINRFVGPGDKLRLYSFSAFVPGQYMQLRFAGELNKPLAGKVRDEVGMQSLRTFDKCVAQQQTFMQKKFGQVFVQTLREATEDIPRSEIFHSLREIGHDLATRPSEERVILLLSDMLENSDFGSFYANSRIRDLDPSAELKRVAERHLFADLQGARVYVAGAGLVTKGVKHSYRSGKTMEQLQRFWSGYFEGSNASLAAFGTPSLNVDLQ
ncbi:hypothetical protein C4Q28_20535 [Pseudomonas sp. SWI6]|uniref:hypothetical protein n=1 Tax=Pseudomonas TaxID=286 RepID=UPI0003C09C24|nr:MULTISPECIES: hypothetical protein [Pseudomonas]AGZ34059.1 hypothetical protein PVLB_06260 [Pseudomonas sp. VLB120]AVD84378.1 hypothetical protein C4Q28_20535 [Pseudomonas sp. SWI6]MDT8922130.1 hypothetical protein [Pseudomonas taiwanensis]